MLEPAPEPFPALRWKGGSKARKEGFQHWKGIPAGVPAGVPALEGGSSRVPAGLQHEIQHSFYLHIRCPPATFLTLLYQSFILIMDRSNFQVLASWLDKAYAVVGTRGYSAPVGCELETLIAQTTGTAAIFKPTTTVGRVQVKGLIMHDRPPRVVSDYITEVINKNPHVPIVLFFLHPKVVDDLHLSITSRLATNSNSTMKLHVWEDQSGDVLFARRPPTSKKMGKDNYLLPHPTTHTLRFLSLKDARRQIPIYSLPTFSQLYWRLDDRYGRTTPTMMSTTQEEPFLLFLCATPLH